MAEPPMRQTCKLFDFSIEVLENILQYLDSLHLLRVGLLSRQAHTFLLPYYFRRCNLKYSDDLSTVDYLSFNRDKMTLTEDAFRAIRTSPVVTKVKHLYCIFSFPEHQFLWEIRSVYTVLLKLQHVEKIGLNFIKIPNRLMSHPFPRLKSISEWRYALRVFMQTVLDKSPLSLSVFYPPDGIFDGPYRGNDSVQLQVSFWRKLVTWGTLTHRRRPPTIGKRSLLDCIFLTAIQPHAPRSTSLESITRLRLSAKLRQEAWGMLASHFTLPSLTSLTLDMEYQMGFKEILRFLERHPTLSTFYLKRVHADETYAPKDYITPDTFLPHLKDIRAPLDLILILLGPRSAAKFGDLESVKVFEELDQPPHWESVSRRLTDMAPRLEGKDISLYLDLRELQRDLFPKQPSHILSGMKIRGLCLCVLDIAGESQDLVPWISGFTDLEHLSIRSLELPQSTPWSVKVKLAEAVYVQHPNNLHSVTVGGDLIPNPGRAEHPVRLSTARPHM